MYYAVSNILHIKIHHIYTTTLQSNVQILIILLFYTTPAVYKSG